MINDGHKPKTSRGITEEDVINSLLDKNSSLKVIQAVLLSIDIYEQDILSVDNENKTINNEDKWNHCNHMPMLSLLGGNHCLPLFHMAKRFIWLNETK